MLTLVPRPSVKTSHVDAKPQPLSLAAIPGDGELPSRSYGLADRIGGSPADDTKTAAANALLLRHGLIRETRSSATPPTNNKKAAKRKAAVRAGELEQQAAAAQRRKLHQAAEPPAPGRDNAPPPAPAPSVIIRETADNDAITTPAEKAAFRAQTIQRVEQLQNFIGSESVSTFVSRNIPTDLNLPGDVREARELYLKRTMEIAKETQSALARLRQPFADVTEAAQAAAKAQILFSDVILNRIFTLSKTDATRETFAEIQSEIETRLLKLTPDQAFAEITRQDGIAAAWQAGRLAAFAGDFQKSGRTLPQTPALAYVTSALSNATATVVGSITQLFRPGLTTKERAELTAGTVADEIQFDGPLGEAYSVAASLQPPAPRAAPQAPPAVSGASRAQTAKAVAVAALLLGRLALG